MEIIGILNKSSLAILRTNKWGVTGRREEASTHLLIAYLSQHFLNLMKRSALLFAVLLLLGGTVPLNSHAQSFRIGPRATVSLGNISDLGGDVGIGANGRVDIPDVPVNGDAAFTYFFADDPTSVWTLDLNALYPFPLEEQTFLPYAGGGLALTNTSVEIAGRSASNTDVALNLVGGVEFDVGVISPFLEVNVGVGGDVDRFGLSGGLLFSLGSN